jgi:hypothetical protein
MLGDMDWNIEVKKERPRFLLSIGISFAPAMPACGGENDR